MKDINMFLCANERMVEAWFLANRHQHTRAAGARRSAEPQVAP